MDTLMGKMGCTPILSIKVSTKKIKGAVHKNGDVDGTCKQNYAALSERKDRAPQFTTQPVWCHSQYVHHQMPYYAAS